MSTHAAWIRFATALTIGVVAASDVSAQIVKLTRISGGVEVGIETSHQETESETGPTRTFDRYRFDEEVELSADGYVLTSQLLNFHLGGSFGLRQELLDGSNESGETNTTLVLVTHDLDLAARCDRILYMDAGRIEREERID